MYVYIYGMHIYTWYVLEIPCGFTRFYISKYPVNSGFFPPSSGFLELVCVIKHCLFGLKISRLN